jgi:LmbE family N-acetylglucosaminyl deacetylase
VLTINNVANNEFVQIPSLVPIPDIMQSKRVLAFQAHYDDTDISVGGLISLLIAQGAEILYVTATDDLAGIVDLDQNKEKAARALNDESHNAMKILGVSGLIQLGHPDAGDWSVHEVRKSFMSVVRQYQPDCVLTLDPWLGTEAHSDHYKSGFAAVEASILSYVPGVEDTHVRIPEKFVSSEQRDLKSVGMFTTSEANCFIDITRVLDQKLLAVSSYNSQFSPEDMKNLLSNLKNRAKHIANLGKSAGKLSNDTEYAECLKVLSPNALHAAR